MGSMNSADSGMTKKMGLVIAAIVLLGLLAAVAARLLSGGGDSGDDSLMHSMMAQRLEPLGKVRTSADDLPDQAVPEAAPQQVAGGSDRSAQELIDGACAACHAAGVAGAPKIGDEEAWAPRREAGLDALVASVMNGKGAMPPKGGTTYSDDEIRRAVQHISMLDGADDSAAATGESADADASASGGAAVAAAAEAAPEAAPQQVVDSSEVSGQELVNGACAACHVAGVAGAPKLNDEEAWAPRREAGLDALVASVMNGKGAMPPKGGSAYSDDEIRRAVQHIALFDSAGDSAAATGESADASGDATAAVETEAAPTAEQSDEAGTVTDSAASGAAAGTAAVAALQVGVEPEGVTDTIKSTVDSACSACHLAGIAGAPKIGDTAAWQERADKGLDELVNSVMNGKGAMPPRGASSLTDEEIPLAIQYLMSK